jgi:hypothetical protein
MDEYDLFEKNLLLPNDCEIVTEKMLLSLGFKQMDKYSFVKESLWIHYRVRRAKFIFRRGSPPIETFDRLESLFYGITGKRIIETI